MNHEISARASCDNNPSQRSQVNIDLNLRLEDIAARLPENREQARAEVFRIVAEQTVPQLVQNGLKTPSPVDAVQPTAWEIDSKGSFQALAENGRCAVYGLLALQIDLSSRDPVHPFISLYNAKAGVAAAVADHVVHRLDHELSGTRRTNVKSAANMDGDKVTYFEANEIPSAQ